MRIHRPAITGSISATNLIVSGTITAEGVQVPHGTAVSSSFAQKSAVSSSFAQKSAVSSSFVTSSAFTGNMGDISGSSISTGSFGHVMKGGVNWDSAVSTSAASEGFTASPAITAIASTAANQILTDDGDGTVTSEANLTFDGTDLTVEAGDIIFGTAGKGINLGVTANTDSNTLDDYEEGIFTIAWSTTGGSINAYVPDNTMRYTKIGDTVFISGGLGISSVSSPTGNLDITGLPFTCGSGLAEGGNQGAVTVRVAGLGGATDGYITGWVAPSQTFITIQEAGNTDGGTEDTANNFDDDSSMAISGFYSVL